MQVLCSHFGLREGRSLIVAHINQCQSGRKKQNKQLTRVCCFDSLTCSSQKAKLCNPYHQNHENCITPRYSSSGLVRVPSERVCVLRVSWTGSSKRQKHAAMVAAAVADDAKLLSSQIFPKST
jgi:hypothetical protein